MLTIKSWTRKILPCAIAFASTHVNANQLEEVIVTAQKRAESLQDVPISVAAMSGDKIRDAGIMTIEDLSAYVPNFTMTESAVGNVVFIRGVGSGINQGFEQSVGMFIDGVYLGRSQQFRAPFLDVGMVEVLKGPQGTLFGKNTIAGAVNITTMRPSDEFEGEVSAFYEPEYDTQEYTAILSGPLTDTLAARLALRKSTSDGYMENVLTGNDEPERDEEIARLTLAWSPTSQLEVVTKLETGSFDVDGRVIQVGTADGVFGGANLGDAIFNQFGPVEDGKINQKKASRGFLPEATDTSYDLATVTVDYDVDGYTLTSVTGYSSYEYDEWSDVDFTALALLDQGYDQDFDQFSQELRITSPLGQTIEYIAGLYYQTNELDHQTVIPVALAEAGIGAPPFTLVRPFKQESDTLAVFAQGTWNIRHDLRMTAGLRWSQEDKDAEQGAYAADFLSDNPNPALAPVAASILGAVEHAYSASRSENHLSPSLNIQYDLSNDIMVYASASQGFKAGGFNEAENTGVIDRFEYEEEEATSFELGSKMSLLDGAAELNGALFYTEYDDRQVSAFEGTNFVVGNAAKSITQGIELDGRWAATGNLTLSSSVSYLDSEFDDFTDAGCTAAQTRVSMGPCTQDLSGEVTEFAPKWSANVAAEYIARLSEYLDLRLQLDANYSDKYFFAQDLDEFESQDAYTKINARIGLGGSDGMWEVALVGKNLTDKRTLSHGNDIPLFNGAHFSFLEEPRTVAVFGVYRF
jgi:outer membrane receptor protein involved in Fe transport